MGGKNGVLGIWEVGATAAAVAAAEKEGGGGKTEEKGKIEDKESAKDFNLVKERRSKNDEDAPRIEKEQTVTTWERPQQRKKECYKVLWQRKA